MSNVKVPPLIIYFPTGFPFKIYVHTFRSIKAIFHQSEYALGSDYFM
ncbi:hypothetical protein [Priestia megaterium]|nr:hypothetical protein [Priestia megaterium]MCM3308574.1 hypothetical protein [Priestia megaterium]